MKNIEGKWKMSIDIRFDSHRKIVYSILSIIVLLFLSRPSVFAQSKEKMLMDKLTLASDIMIRNPDSCEHLINEVIRAQNGSHIHSVNSRIYMIRARKCIILGDINGAERYCILGQNYILKNSPWDTTNLIGFKVNLASIHYIKDYHYVAYKELLKLGSLLKPKANVPIKDSVLWYHTQLTLSLCLVEIGRAKEAINNWKGMLADLEARSGHPKYRHVYKGVLVSLATSLLKEKEAEEAIAYYMKALPLAQGEFYLVDRFSLYSDLASCYNLANNKDSAIKYLNLAKEMVNEHSEPRTKSSYYQAYAEYYEKEKNWEQGLKFINSAIMYFPDLTLRPELYKIKANFFEKINERDSAFIYISKYNEMRDSQIIKSREKLVYELDQVYKAGDLKLKLSQEKIRRKQVQLAGEREKSKRIKYQIISICIFLLLGLLFIIFKLRMNQRMILEAKKIERDLLLARMDGQDFEKDRIARDLHDSVVNDLMNVYYYLDSSQMKGEPLDLVNLKNKLITIKDDIRDFAYDITPEHLLNSDFIHLFKSNMEALTNKGLRVEFNNEWAANNYLTEHQKVELIKMIKEITNNLLNHSNASDLVVKLFNANDETAVIRLVDNGKEYRLNSNKWNSIGTDSLFKRANKIGAAIYQYRESELNVLDIRLIIESQFSDINVTLSNAG